MAAPVLSYGIPDISLKRAGDGPINPSDFVGHELVVFFCPSDPDDAAREIDSFRRHAAAFADAGAWVIGILAPGCAEPEAGGGEAAIALSGDPDGEAWSAFESLIAEGERGEGREGGTFLFARGGSLDAAWIGCGHAEDALGALRGSGRRMGRARGA